MMDIMLYVNPSTSLCVFIAWMRCVYINSMACVPLYFAIFILIILLRNYRMYGVDEEFNCGFTPITISEVFHVLFRGGPNTKFIKPIRRKAHSIFGKDDEDGVQEITETVFQKGVGFWQMDGDHVEFPFSEAGRYPKKTLAEACVNSSAFQEKDDDDEHDNDTEFFSLAGAAGSAIRGAKKTILKSSAPQPDESSNRGKQKQNRDKDMPAVPDKVWKR